MSEIKLLNKWSFNGIEVKDPGLKKYINLKPVIIPRTFGRFSTERFKKNEMNIVERFLNRLNVPGHKGKKHVISSARCVGDYFKKLRIIEEVFERIEKITKKNPIEVLVRAIEKCALMEEIASYQVGGIIVRKAVVVSPQRRVDLAIRNLTQAAYRKSFNKKATIVDALVEEIIGAYNNDSSRSDALKERERIEKEAEVSR
ncbi:MAG: 30S ribosomal protein S7 [Candidatus Aenigmarchaeota archaeon]|nr:30S ribosomal protein S7 [Candidatus Aenigmarchaeota archaeon]MDW8149149.1 30S ribosomal protein S7 [Candidatus Aenigmarchaeota archaeon]